MKKKRKISRTTAMLALNSAPKTTYASTQKETLHTFTANLLAEQAEAERQERELREAPARQAAAEHSRLLLSLIEQDRVAGFDVPSSFLATTAPQVTPEHVRGETVESLRAQMRRALGVAESSLVDVRLTDSGRIKLRNLANANRAIDWTKDASWTQAISLLRLAEEFKDQSESNAPDIIVTEIPDEPVKKSFSDVLDENSTFSREGKRAIAQAAMNDMQEEALHYFTVFRDNIKRDFGYTLTEEDVTALKDVMKARNYSWTNAKDWHRAKLAAISQGRLPSKLRTPAELLDAEIEATDFSKNEFEAKRRLRQLERQLGVGSTQAEY